METNKKKKVLLVEPGFKTKFPPLGLLKISTYHKLLGDDVYFHKGSACPEHLLYTYWDRIYISTLFTYHWDVTVKTINSFKALVDDYTRIKGTALRLQIPIMNTTRFLAFTGLVPVKRLVER